MAITNEGLAVEIKNLSVQIADLKTTIALNANSYVAREVYEIQLKEIHARIDIIKAEQRQIARGRWTQNTLSAILGIVLSLLVTFFITNVGR